MKNIYTSLCLVIIVGLLQTNLCWSQEGAVDFDSNKPSPSAMSTYIDVPVDYCTGIPDISYGLMSLPTTSKDFSFNLSLSYHPNNTTVNNKISDVGRGWDWSGIPSITKNPNGKPDEVLWFNTITPEWAPSALDDNYYYSINGESGRFKFVYDYNSGTVSIKLITPTQLKFSFTTTSVGVLVVDSYQVTDANGIVYKFEKYDVNKVSYFDAPAPARTQYYLTSVYDSNGILLCNISYEQVYTEFFGSNFLLVSLNRINEIVSHGMGKIKFDYQTDTSLIIKNMDISRLNGIALLTPSNSQIRKCVFNFGSSNAAIRKLQEISFMGTNSTAVENYKFAYKELTGTNFDYDNLWVFGTELVKKYDRYGFTHVTNACSVSDIIIPKSTYYSNTNTVTTGILRRVTLPTGGVIEYDFEPNEIDSDGYAALPFPNLKSTNIGDDFNEALLGAQTLNSFTLKPFNPDNWWHLNEPRAEHFYLENLGSFDYSVATGTDTGRFFQITEQTELFIRFNGYPNSSPVVPDNELPIGFQIRKANTVVGSFLQHQNPDACMPISPKMDLAPGWYTIHITSLNGGAVNYTMFAKRKKAVVNTNYYAAGVRVKSIKNYENKDSTVPLKSLSFDYNDFSTPSRSSGQVFYKGLGRNVDTFDGVNAFVLYKNVKVSEEGNGYIRYGYYVPGDFDTISTARFYSVLRGGLLHKKEVYNAQSVLLEVEKYYYDVQPVYSLLIDSSFDWLHVYDSYLKRKYSKSEKYFSGSTTAIMKSVGITNEWNFKPESTTVFDSQNKKLKTRYYYINEVPATPYVTDLTAKNIISSPLLVEQYYDGVLMSRAKSEFDSFGNGLFKKAKSYVAKGTGDYTLEQRVSKVDNVANKIQEVTNDKGAYTSYIWGYNKTQPVAKIENMAYASIPTALITAIQSATNVANNEANILAALDALRSHAALAGAMVTTYTYKPLVGIQSVTDPKGDRVTYHYDTFNRLIAVKDRNDNVLTENQYNFRP